MELTVPFLQGIAAITTFAVNAKNFIPNPNPNISPAIIALTKAVHETEMYFRDRVRGLERDFSREDALSRLWSDAEEPVRLVDPQLSELCRYKAKYWLFPESYSRSQVVELHITLEGMNAALQRLRDIPE
ncbi:hypothetical protein [Enterobacter ludwigii]|uniref:hypothetical protein n=1 Tax=Enterobacter ludwigii TaxID=299767 RepID=UPI003F5AF2B6